MATFNRKDHWENIYQTKGEKEVSWYQKTPQISLEFLTFFNVPKSANIIDIGGGDSYLVDHLLDLGYHNITVLDISAEAISKVKTRLGERARNITWIVSDVVQFKAEEQYDFWHDRAAFHFLTSENEIEQYLRNVKAGTRDGGHIVLGTFSENGPSKCSGIPIKQYSEEELATTFDVDFEKIKCVTVDHETPFETIQNFTFCGFKKKS